MGIRFLVFEEPKGFRKGMCDTVPKGMIFFSFPYFIELA